MQKELQQYGGLASLGGRFKKKLLSAPTQNGLKIAKRDPGVLYRRILGVSGRSRISEWALKSGLSSSAANPICSHPSTITEQMLSTLRGYNVDTFTLPQRELPRGSLARKNSVDGLPTRFLSRTGMMKALPWVQPATPAWRGLEPLLTRYVVWCRSTRRPSAPPIFMSPHHNGSFTSTHRFYMQC